MKESQNLIKSTHLLQDTIDVISDLPKKFRIHQYSSGSAQFALHQYPNMKKMWPSGKTVIMVDLRQECHFFLNDLPVAFWNQYFTYYVGKTNIADVEKDIAQNYHPSYFYRFDKTKTFMTKIPIHTKANLPLERNVVDIEYKRFYVTDRTFPTPEIVDEFLSWIKTLPSNVWLHFHCRGGKGRTTTFMLLYDIWKTKGQYPLKVYLKRQKKIGGTDLSITLRANAYLSKNARERFLRIQQFHQYVKEGMKITWKEFLNFP